MAVVTYTVTVVGGAVTISPDINQVEFVNGDFAQFNDPVGAAGDILVQVSGGPPKIVVAAAETGKKLKLQAPTLDAAGNIIISFAVSGGNPGDTSNFPP